MPLELSDLTPEWFAGNLYRLREVCVSEGEAARQRLGRQASSRYVRPRGSALLRDSDRCGERSLA